MFITYYTIVFPSLISEYSVLITLGYCSAFCSRIGVVVIATWSVSSQFQLHKLQNRLYLT